MTNAGAIALALVFFCAGFSTARAVEADSLRPKHIVLVTVEGVRNDAVSSEHTPQLAALGADGVTFTHAVTASPQALPGIVSLHTGLLPVHHGVPDAYSQPLTGAVTLAEHLRSAGWHTTAFPADVQAHDLSGVARGFERYAHHAAAWTNATRADSAAAVLGAGADAPLFIWVDLTLAPRRVGWQRHVGSGSRDRQAYLDGIRALDSAIGRIRRAVDDRGDAALVVVGTHGEEVPGWSTIFELPDVVPGSGVDLTEAQLRVPFVAYVPGLAPRRAETWVSTVDVTPTVLALAGLDTGSASLDGRSLLDRLTGDDPGAGSVPRAIFHETDTSRLTGIPRRLAVRIGSEKLLVYGDRHLALDTDSFAPSDPAETRKLLDALERTYPGVDSSPASAEELSAENAPLLALDHALARGVAGDPRGARAVVESLAVESPGNGIIQIECGLTYSFGRNEARAAFFFDDLCEQRPELVEAQTAYTELLFLYSRHDVVVERLDTLKTNAMYEPERLWVLGAGLTAARRFDDALQTFERAAAESAPPVARWERFREHATDLREAYRTLDIYGKGYAPHLELGKTLGELGLFRDAYEHLNQARAFRIDLAEPDYWLGHFLVIDSRPRHAIVAFDNALEREPEHVGALTEKAYAHLSIGELDEAFDALSKAVDTGEAAPDVHYNYACLLARRGEADAALHQLEIAIVKGYDDRERLTNDADLDPLRSLPRFPDVIGRVSAR